MIEAGICDIISGSNHDVISGSDRDVISGSGPSEEPSVPMTRSKTRGMKRKTEEQVAEEVQ